jgi:hypothetical protein
MDSPMTAFHIDCEMSYDVVQQSLFVFNLAIPNSSQQRVIAETITTTPATAYDEFRDEAGHNRFLARRCCTRPFHCALSCTVELQPPLIDVDAPEVPLARLPGELLIYVRPSRYCEVEAIYGFAVRKFGNCRPAIDVCRRFASGSKRTSITKPDRLP